MASNYLEKRFCPQSPHRIVSVGGSIGAFTALTIILKQLPLEFPYPIVVAQHRSADSVGMLARDLLDSVGQKVKEIEDKDELVPGRVHIAPADYHMFVEGDHLSLSVDMPVSYARPSIDVLFESVADACGSEGIAIVLSGANHDGVRGAMAIRRRGGTIIVQDPKTAMSAVLPNAVIRDVGPDYVLGLQEIGSYLERMVREQVS